MMDSSPDISLPTFSFATAIESIEVQNHSFKICHAANIDELFQRLASLPSDHPDVVDERIPYWAEVWPSSIALSDWLFRHPEMVKNKSVLEIGCGLALPSMVAHQLGAVMTVSDYISDPLELVKYNWNLNGMGVAPVMLLDWRITDDVPQADVLLASDVAYERRMFDALKMAFSRLIKPDGVVLISEPQRSLAKEFFEGLEREGLNVSTETIGVTLKGINYKINVRVLRKSDQSR